MSEEIEELLKSQPKHELSRNAIAEYFADKKGTKPNISYVRWIVRYMEAKGLVECYYTLGEGNGENPGGGGNRLMVRLKREHDEEK